MGTKSAATAQVDSLLKGGKKNRKKGKKGRKIGRYSKHPSSQRYKNEKRWLSNRVKRIERHLKRFPHDKQARRALDVAQEAA
jgi:ribosomal protein S15P/S13E